MAPHGIFVLWGAYHGSLLIAHRRLVETVKGEIQDTLESASSNVFHVSPYVFWLGFIPC